MDPTLAKTQYMHPSSLGLDQDDPSANRVGGLRLWQTKFQFQQDMLPMFVGETFGRKVHFAVYVERRC